MAYAKYTFFEAATQHGYLVALMSGRVAKSREHQQIIIDPQRGRVLQVFKAADPGVPFFEFVIPERETTESTMMWRAKTKKGLDSAWARYERERAIARELRSEGPKGPCGADTSESAASTPSKTESSSTDAPPKLASLIGPYGVVEPATAVSVPEPSTPESSPTDKVSSPASAPQSRKSGSKSRSSSGGSKGSSGFATARAGSTPPKS